MAIVINVADNGDTHSPGVDFSITGLDNFDQVLVERLDQSGEFPSAPVRGFDTVTADPVMAGSDFEAPIGLPMKYRVTGYDFNPEIEVDAVGTVNSDDISCFPAIPAGSEAGEIHLLFVTMKPYTATLATPSGWTLIDHHTNGTVASGPDTGSTHIYAFYREGPASGTLTITPSGHNSVAAVIHTFRKTAGSGAWSVSSAKGADTTHGANFSATATTNINPKKGDMIVAMAGLNNDSGGPTNIKIQTSNIGVSETTILTDVGFMNGDDGKIEVAYVTVSHTIAPGAPTYSWNNSVSSMGAAIFVVLSTTGSVTETVLSSTVTVDYSSYADAWIKSVSQPALSRKVCVSDWRETDYKTRVYETYEILGRPKPVITTDAWGSREGTITIVTDADLTPTTARQLKLLLTEGSTLLFQTADYLAAGEEDMYFEVTSYQRQRVGLIKPNHDISFLHIIGFAEVDKPSTLEEALGLRTFNDILSENGTFQGILENYTSPDDTFLDLLNHAPL